MGMAHFQSAQIKDFVKEAISDCGSSITNIQNKRNAPDYEFQSVEDFSKLQDLQKDYKLLKEMQIMTIIADNISLTNKECSLIEPYISHFKRKTSI